jgi:hypothetical protein
MLVCTEVRYTCMPELKDPFHEFKVFVINLVIAISTFVTCAWLVYLIFDKAPGPVKIILVVALVLASAIALILTLNKLTNSDR